MKYLIVLMFFTSQIFSQTNTIKGKLTGPEGQIVQYATVIVENTSFLSVANEKGEFEITGKFSKDNYISITHVGYEKYRIKISQLDLSKTVKIILTAKPFVSQTVFVEGNIAKEGKTPVAFSKINRAAIKENYSVQDIPAYLTSLPSVNFYSENGNGIGYNYLSIRGFDQRRISVSVNGIPQNEPEDHNVYWLDFPDLLESTEMIQVQRGAGSGLVGYPAIGGSVNIITSTFTDIPGMQFSSSIGAYNTRKYSASFSSGLIGNKYSIYAKLSKTLSSGYRNSSWTDFNSYHISAVRYDANFTTQLNFYGGPVSDGLAYTGLPKFAVKDKELRKKNYSYWEADGSSITYATERRPEEVENFSQPHFELLNEVKLSDNVKLNSALFLVIGQGYFDYDGSWGDSTYFRLTKENGFNLTQNPGNVLIRAMVENNQWGWIPRVNISHKNGELILGGELRIHRSLHWGAPEYGENLPAGITKDFRYYQYEAGNNIMAFYANENYQLTNDINILLESQFAYHQYRIFNEKYLNNDFKIGNLFFNPRIGVNYKYNTDLNFYLSFARISREPRLKNYYDAAESSGGEVPQFETRTDGSYDFDKPLVNPETMNDFEFGINYMGSNISLSVNAYYMLFSDEIVKQGQVDRFGQPITGNMNKTLHRGVEVTSVLKPVDGLEILLNASISSNIIDDGITYVKYKDPVTKTKTIKALNLSDNRISGFSDLMFGGIIRYKKYGITLQLETKYTGDFYSDNYGSNLTKYRSMYPGITTYADNKVDAYFTTNLFAGYDFNPGIFFNNIKVFIQVNNVFDKLYAAYAIGGEFFPAAERNLLFGIKVGL
jgi:iron complex outermembrane receptor protein